MKKGCFIRSIVILTILIAAILYIVKNKFNDFVLTPGKNWIAAQLDDEFNAIKPSPEKDSLKAAVSNYFSGVRNLDELKGKQIKNIMVSIQEIIGDSVINHIELSKIKEMLNQVNDERSKKD